MDEVRRDPLRQTRLGIKDDYDKWHDLSDEHYQASLQLARQHLVMLRKGKVLFAGLDVFENEPTPEIQILMHPKISLTPHIGAATLEAQDRIGTELAEQIISLLKNEK